MEKGKLNRITDVEGVLVGHKTICSDCFIIFNGIR